MRYLIIFVTFILLSVIACKKEAGDKVHAVDASSITDDDSFFDATFEADENEGDLEDYQTEVTNPVKVLKVTSTDSMNQYKDPNATPLKRLKYGKRQIAFDTTSTEITLEGVAFDVRSDSSKVLCVIKKDTLGFAQIVTWDTNKIVLTLPALAQSYSNITFSVKFKLFRKNPIAGKKSIYRTKSRAFIGQTLAKNTRGAAGVQQCKDIIIFGTALAWRKTNLNLTAYNTNHNYFGSNYAGPQVGDILIEATVENYTKFGEDITGIVKQVTSPTDIIVESFIKESCNDPELYPRSHTTMRYLLLPIPSNSARKRWVPATATQDERFQTMYYEIYMR